MEQYSKNAHITTKRQRVKMVNILIILNILFIWQLSFSSSWMSNGEEEGGKQMDHLPYLHNPSQTPLIHTYQEKQHQTSRNLFHGFVKTKWTHSCSAFLNFCFTYSCTAVFTSTMYKSCTTSSRFSVTANILLTPTSHSFNSRATN